LEQNWSATPPPRGRDTADRCTQLQNEISRRLFWINQIPWKPIGRCISFPWIWFFGAIGSILFELWRIVQHSIQKPDLARGGGGFAVQICSNLEYGKVLITAELTMLTNAQPRDHVNLWDWTLCESERVFSKSGRLIGSSKFLYPRSAIVHRNTM